MLLRHRKQFAIFGAAILLIGMVSVGIFSHPKPAAAFPTLTAIIADPWREIKSFVDKALKTAIAVAYKSGLSYFLNRVAYDTASYLGSGGKGAKPAFITKGWDEYLKDTGDEALGEFLTTGIDVAVDTQIATKQAQEECAQYCLAGEMEMFGGSQRCLNGFYKDVTIPPVLGPDGSIIKESAKMPMEEEFEACLMRMNSKIIDNAAERTRTGAGSKAKEVLNLCAPISVDIEAQIQLTAREILEPSRPRCSWSDIKKKLPQSSVRINGVDVFRTDYSALKLSDLPSFAAYYNPSENDIGAILTIVAEGQRVSSERKLVAQYDREENKGFQPVEDLVTGEIKTPAVVREEAVKDALTKKPGELALQFTGDAFADAFKIFSNTLVSKLFKRITEKGFNPRIDRSLASGQGGALGGTAGARLAFADLLKTDFTTDTAVDVLVELASTACDAGGPETCAITEQFRIAIENKLTVREAVEAAGTANCPRCQGLLSPNLVFGFDASDFRTGIPYRSIVILRKHRIVPVGWELAARYRQQFDAEAAPLTLGYLMRQYDACGQDGSAPSPYCRLVDPQWVLKAPLSHCYREGFGEKNTAVLTTPVCDDPRGCPPGVAAPPVERAQVCADERSCIIEGGAEGCNAFGYCTQEKGIWRIEGESCPAQFASCLALTHAATGENHAFVMNTTDATGCTRTASVGCRRYAKAFDAATGGWKDSLQPDMNYFLNQDARDAAERSCKDARAVGCTEYLRVRHLDAARRAFTVAEYENLVDDAQGGEPYADLETREATPVYLNASARSCEGPAANPGQFVGCALFAPRDQNTLQAGIPARPVLASVNADNQISAWNDECPAECVGYAQFEQAATEFEDGISLLPDGVRFIPSTARQCPAQDAGCDEFTNLDEVARGGEGKEYYTALRQCVKPGAGGGEQTYYTWQGSDTTGFQLKAWSLVRGSGGAPEVSGAKAERVDPAQGWDGIDCEGDFNSANPDPDCREFIDASLNYYYRYWSKTVEASDNCHPYRRTLDQTIHDAIPSQGVTCAASSAGCREYRGGQGGSVETVFADTFENGSFDPWSGGGVALSNESVLRGGHSLKIVGTTAARVGITVENGKTYILRVWARSENGAALNFTLGAAPNATSLGWRTVGTAWEQYTYGPETASNLPSDAMLQAFFPVGSTVYLDNVVLQTAQVYAIKDSWTTPASCDQDPPGTTLAGAHVGCAAYGKEGSGDTGYFRRFSNLCPAEYVGCEALIDTQNSNSAAGRTFYPNTASAVTVPADELAYLIPTDAARCESTQAGCTVLGQASLAFARDPKKAADVEFNDTVIMADPDAWDDTVNESTNLCKLEEEYCAQWAVTEVGGTRTFRDPTGITCEFKTEQNVTAWYKTGTSEFCPTAAAVRTCANAPYIACASDGDCPLGSEQGVCRVLGHCIGGRSMNTAVAGGISYHDANLCISDADCLDYSRPGAQGLCSNAVGRCAPEHSTCAEFQDPRLPEGCDTSLVYGEKRCTIGKACSNMPTRSCNTNTECPTGGFCAAALCATENDCVGAGNECAAVSCDYYYVPRREIQSALTACTGLNPEDGCVGFHETGGGPDNVVTQKRCSNSPNLAQPIVCTIDADCMREGQKGRCEYQQGRSL